VFRRALFCGRIAVFLTAKERPVRDKLYGAVEAGGTKFLVAVGTDPTAPQEVERIATTPEPAGTMEAVIEYFRRRGPVAGIGVASFGPVDFARGAIGKTPKLGWQGYPLAGTIEKAVGVRVEFDTDVGAAAQGELLYGAGRGLESFVYITVGTGIGGGAVVHGQTLRGLMHPEMGHLLVRRHADDPQGFRGVCPFHGDCLEGMASGPAMEARWGQRAETLEAGHGAWRLEAYYLAQACFSVACILSPQRIVLGGGVMRQAALFPMIREELARQGNGYLPLPEIVPPELESPALSGALAMARAAGI
jgi:fructokinase